MHDKVVVKKVLVYFIDQKNETFSYKLVKEVMPQQISKSHPRCSINHCLPHHCFCFLRKDLNVKFGSLTLMKSNTVEVVMNQLLLIGKSLFFWKISTLAISL